jgi:geranylgeranyl pyrophosphate synthase
MHNDDGDIAIASNPANSTSLPDTAPSSNRDGASEGSKRSARRKTSHLKLVPETRELREQIKTRCDEVAARMDRSHALTKDQMEQVARRLLEEMGLGEGYVGWTMVLLSSSFFRDQVAATDPSRRLFLLPHCLKHAEGCPADYDEFGMNCKKCGACSIADFRSIAEQMGYKVLVAEGSPVVLKIIVSGYVDAIVGVACLNVLEKAIDKILLAGIPCMAVPLLSSDCRNTSVDEDWVLDMVQVQQAKPSIQTRSYVHLMRAASGMFESPRIDELVMRQRPASESEADSDPIAFTEQVAIEFLAKGGKYSRPFITLAAYDALTGGNATMADGARTVEAFPDAIYRAALSIEIFHKASLVHDDIEDDDAFRYGEATMHRRLGVPTAVNVGDYLVGLGYRMVSRERQALGADVSADILEILSHAHMRLSEGQGAELFWRDGTQKQIAPLDALKIYALKTAPAFEAALLTGIRLSGQSIPTEPVRQFARNLGVAFQILNDLGDWQGDQHNKMQAAADLLGGRPTILLALAMQGLPPEDVALLQQVVAKDCSLPDRERIDTARRLFQQAQVFQQARLLVEKHQQRALQAAQQIPSELLQRLMNYLVDTVLESPHPEPPPVVPLVATVPLGLVSKSPS